MKWPCVPSGGGATGGGGPKPWGFKPAVRLRRRGRGRVMPVGVVARRCEKGGGKPLGSLEDRDWKIRNLRYYYQSLTKLSIELRVRAHTRLL